MSCTQLSSETYSSPEELVQEGRLKKIKHHKYAMKIPHTNYMKIPHTNYMKIPHTNCVILSSTGGNSSFSVFLFTCSPFKGSPFEHFLEISVYRAPLSSNSCGTLADIMPHFVKPFPRLEPPLSALFRIARYWYGIV